jgi:predicted nucleic acid-binding protein
VTLSQRTFIDTNVFVYAEDADEPDKRETAQGLIRQLALQQRGVVSTQVLTEYIAAARRRLKFSLAECRQTVILMRRFDVVLIKPELVLEALDLAITYQLSHWDALILKAASVSGCGVLLTEDLQDGRTIEGVRIENPFG